MRDGESKWRRENDRMGVEKKNPHTQGERTEREREREKVTVRDRRMTD
jgi:hypothetical protein